MRQPRGPWATPARNCRAAWPADAPDRAAERRRLGVTKAREQRGLITPAQAEQQRATFCALNAPQARPDAQKIIDHRQENQTLMDH